MQVTMLKAEGLKKLRVKLNKWYTVKKSIQSKVRMNITNSDGRGDMLVQALEIKKYLCVVCRKGVAEQLDNV